MPTSEDNLIESQAEEAKLPELELEQILRSKGKVSENPIKQVRGWNNYTLINDGTVIKIIDETGEVKHKMELKTTVYQASYKTFYDSNVAYTIKKLTLPKIPLSLRPQIKKMIGREDSTYISSNSRFDFEADRVELIGEFLVLIDSDSGAWAYKTVSENGVILPPKEWKRINPGDPELSFLDPYERQLFDVSGGFRELNDSYSALITEVGLNISDKQDANGRPVFSETTPSIGSNLTVDPQNKNIVYYSSETNPKLIYRLDISGTPSDWHSVPVEIPGNYESIRNLQMDPSGNFFLFYCDKDLVIITKDTLQEVKRVGGLTNVSFDNTGNIRAIDNEKNAVIYRPDFEALIEEMDKRRFAKLAKGISIDSLFDQVAQSKGMEEAGDNQEILELREKYTTDFQPYVDKVADTEDAKKAREVLKTLRSKLRSQGVKPSELDFIMTGLEQPLIAKEAQLAEDETRMAVGLIAKKLAGGLSVLSISEAREMMQKVKAVELMLPGDLRQQVHLLEADLNQKSIELFRQRSEEIIKDVNSIISMTRKELEGYNSKSQMDDWLEFRFPQLKQKFGSLAHECPLEAEAAFKAISEARQQLGDIAATYEEKFKVEYAKVREKASERLDSAVEVLNQDLEGLMERLRGKGFADRDQAEQYLNSSEARKALEAEILGLQASFPEAAKELSKALKVRLSNTLSEIERGGLSSVSTTGQQMVMVGDTPFPKFEAAVKEKKEAKYDLIFDEDPKSHGPGVGAGKIQGDISILVTRPDGKKEKVRLYEGWNDEQEWRLGMKTRLGEPIAPSYLSADEYKLVKKNYLDWSKGERSNLRKQYQEYRAELSGIVKEGKTSGKNDGKWEEAYKEKLGEFSKFCSENNISILKRIDSVKKRPTTEQANGKGYVPEWQSHWVMDAQTEEDLGEMAKALEMQLKLQEGILNLKGHAGTGKDVRLKMFCSLTHRPYFGIDCTKWTTEFELSEDVVLESENGATQTVKVPSTVLNGISTPGAIVYFNEFNAMPEQAQIFLHALMDEKRSLTLKTSSGKVIKAQPSVLLVSSMNPGYPGTNEPQFATRSRMISLDIDYPPLYRENAEGDNNSSPAYDASEALRMARGVDSLDELTIEANLEHNEFVQIWDNYINGIDNGAQALSEEQKFDVDTILALVQFAENIRVAFIKIFEKSRESGEVMKKLPATQPFTGREFRRCAYELNRLSSLEKESLDPEKLAKQLIEKYYLSHIDKKESKQLIKTAINSWTSKKRPRS